ncbi:MAG: glycosyltransferase family 2 protein, partial [Magnetococcales bacterium]|nr:glycosyltransferase family 2 protein [Magnetococcales bacterium]
MNKLTILLTTRNRRATLQRALEAIFATVDPAIPFEVLVADDGSTDDTPAFLNALAGSNPSISTLRNPTALGPAAARNRGIRQASGDFVLIAGDDVIFQAGAIGLLYHHALTHDMSRASVIGNIGPCPEGITPFEHWCSHGGSQFTHYRIQESERLDCGEAYFYTSNILTPRTLLLEYPFDESFPYPRYEDRELGYRLRRAVGHMIHYEKNALSTHRHPLRVANWLTGFKTFVWSALQSANLHPPDATLARQLGLERARNETCFDFSA